MTRRLLALTALALGVAALTAVATPAADSAPGGGSLRKIKHIVVIYQENHSFDNLYGGWERVNGLTSADAAHTIQISQSGSPFACLLQNDVNIVAKTGGTCVLPNTWFTIDTYIPATDTTCPAPGAFYPNGILSGSGQPGGCTRDIVHRFYQEQFQIHGGNQDRYAQGSDAAGLVMGVYDTKALPIYRYLNSENHPRYAIADNFFQGAFGGSFLNHQYLIAAAAPVDTLAADASKHSILDTNGFPNSTYPLYRPTTPTVKDSQLTQACGLPTTNAAFACGDYGVNTMQPSWQPKGGGAVLPPQTGTTIGDRLSAAGVDWAWYAGGWSNAAGIVNGPGWTNGSDPTTCADANSIGNPKYPYCPSKLFQFHHQPFNYFAAFDPTTATGQANRAAHLKDEAEFLAAAQGSTSGCNLKPVSFVKPVGADNEHPGYTSEVNGSNHLVDLIKAIEGSKCAKDTLVVVTYDEFGGAWDHVSPPGTSGGAAGPHDLFGPGTRIPALIVSPRLPADFVVDHASHDTSSILATIEHRWNLQPLGTRDAAVSDLSTVFTDGEQDGNDGGNNGGNNGGN